MVDQAPESSRFARGHLIRKVNDEFAMRIERAEVATRVTADHRAHTEVSLRHAPVWDWDKEAVAALRELPGADPGVPIGSPGRTYTVYWDGVRAPI